MSRRSRRGGRIPRPFSRNGATRMGKPLADFDLGKELRTHRKRARLTQAGLAGAAGLAERTVRALERGSGSLGSWSSALESLGVKLAGRNLPGGVTLGERL